MSITTPSYLGLDSLASMRISYKPSLISLVIPLFLGDLSLKVVRNNVLRSSKSRVLLFPHSSVS